MLIFVGNYPHHNMNNFDFEWLWSSLSAAAAAAITWIFSRRKNTAEAQQSELDNVEKAVEIWRGIATDLEAKFNALEHRVTNMQREIIKLQIENEKLEAENKLLRDQVAELKSELSKHVQQ